MCTFIYDILTQAFENYVGELLRGRTQESVLSTKFIWCWQVGVKVSTLLFLARTTLKYNAFEYPTTCRDWSKPNNYWKVFVYIVTTASFEGLELWLRLWWWKLKVSVHSVMKIVLMEANFDRTYFDTNHQVVAGISAQYFSERDLSTSTA